MNFENFKNWAKTSKRNSVYAALADFEVTIPLHIYQSALNASKQESVGGFINLNYGDSR